MYRLTLKGKRQITISFRQSPAVMNQHKFQDKVYNRLLDVEDTFEDDCLGYQTGKSEEGDTIIIGFKKSDKLLGLLKDMGVKCYDQ